MANLTNESSGAANEQMHPLIDSKYRMIIVAAKRSKQLQRGARPRLEIDPQKHKPTRIALEETLHGKVNFTLTEAKPA